MDVAKEINKYLPKELHITAKDYPLTKAKLSSILEQFAIKYPDLYAKNIHKIGELGEELAYIHGHHVGIDDLLPKNKSKIESFLDRENKKIQLMNTEKRKEHLMNVFNKLQDIVLEEENNHLVDQGKSRGRGNPATITRIIGAPVYTVDMNSEPFPFMIKNSYSKGLKSHEMFATGSQARYAAVQTASSTSEPGAMSKILVANTEDIKIGCEDCHTTNGVVYSLDDPEIIGRYEARTNRLITKEYVSKLKKENKTEIIVRDPTTCQCKTGVCQKCFGLGPNGKPLPIGYNIGIAASQTIGEKTTQLVLSTKHDIKGKVHSNIPKGFEAVKYILNTPDNYKGKATLSTVNGVVTSVKKLPMGGYVVKVSDESHYINYDVKPTVKVGQEVYKGQPLSTGLPSTKDIVKINGILSARKFVQNKLYQEAGNDIDKRIYGVLARGYLSLMKNKGDSDHNLENYDAAIQNITTPHTYKMSIRDPQIKNKYLAEPFLHFDVGTKVNDRILKIARKHNIHELLVSHSQPNIEYVYKTYEQKPLIQNIPVWQKMNYRGIKKSLNEEVLYNDKTKYKHLKSDKAKYTLGVL